MLYQQLLEACCPIKLRWPLLLRLICWIRGNLQTKQRRAIGTRRHQPQSYFGKLYLYDLNPNKCLLTDHKYIACTLVALQALIHWLLHNQRYLLLKLKRLKKDRSSVIQTSDMTRRTIIYEPVAVIHSVFVANRIL